MQSPPQTPRFSFYAVQACFQEHRTISKTGFTRTTVIELFNPVMLAVHLRTAGLRPPQPPHFFKLYKATSSIMLPQPKPEPIWPFSERVIKTSCVQTGGAATRRFSFTPCRFAFKNIVPSTRNCFKNPSCRQMGGLHPPQLSRFLNLCKIASSIILPAETEPHMYPLGTRDKEHI